MKTNNYLFSGKPDEISLDVVESQNKLSITCSVFGCIPPPVITMSTVSGYVIPETSVYTSSNTTTVTGSVILSDSAAIQCMVAVIGTNYTATVMQYYTRYKAMARPYTSHGHTVLGCLWTIIIAIICFWLLFI